MAGECVFAERTALEKERKNTIKVDLWDRRDGTMQCDEETGIVQEKMFVWRVNG